MYGLHRRPSRALALLPALVWLFSACGGEDQEGPVDRITHFVQGRFRSGPILRVEEREFTNADFQTYLRNAAGSGVDGLTPESLSRLFDRFVDEKILLEAARQRTISLTWEEKKNYLAKLASESVSGPETEAPATEGAEPPESVFDGLLIEKYTAQVVRDVRVEEQEIRSYYEGHKKDFLLPERVQVSQILVTGEDKAVDVLRRIVRAGEAEFRTIAREESSGPEAPRGGLMGVYRPGELPSDMEKVIFGMDEGTTSAIVQSSYGYHIFRVDKRFPPQLETGEQASAAIRIRLLGEKVKDALALHLAGLKDTLAWTAFPDNLFFAYQRLDG